MEKKIILGTLIFLACLTPSLILVFGALRKIKEENQAITKLKRNPMDIVNSLLLNGFTFGLSLTLLCWLIIAAPSNFPTWLYTVLILVVFLASIDFVILITHIINEKRQIIHWDRQQHIFNVRQKGNEFQLNLHADTLQITHFYPPRQGSPRGFPGFRFHVLVLSNKDNTLRISSITYDNYDFFRTLSEHKNFTVIKRQFNVLL